MKKALPFLLVATILVLQACASKPVSVPLSERIPQKVGADDQKAIDADAQAGGPKKGITEEELLRADEERRRKAAQEEAALKAALLKDIYFEFDSYVVKSDYLPVLKDIAGWMARNQALRLTVEGHCDERGTTDYNLALGQKRADAVRDYLLKLGVSAARIKAVSYGKEAPVDASHTEEAWARNRRAHFVAE